MVNNPQSTQRKLQLYQFVVLLEFFSSVVQRRQEISHKVGFVLWGVQQYAHTKDLGQLYFLLGLQHIVKNSLFTSHCDGVKFVQ